MSFVMLPTSSTEGLQQDILYLSDLTSTDSVMRSKKSQSALSVALLWALLACLKDKSGEEIGTTALALSRKDKPSFESSKPGILAE